MYPCRKWDAPLLAAFARSGILDRREAKDPNCSLSATKTFPTSSSRHSNQPLRHRHKMTRDSRVDLGRKWLRSCLHVTALLIKPRQFAAHIDHPYVHCSAARLRTMPLGCIHQHRANTSSLPLWIDRQQAQISSLAPLLHVDASDDIAAIESHQEFPFFQE